MQREREINGINYCSDGAVQVFVLALRTAVLLHLMLESQALVQTSTSMSQFSSDHFHSLREICPR